MHFAKPRFTLIPNVSARPTQQPLELRDLLSRHLISPVRWDATLRAMGEIGASWFVEAGPGDVLSKLARRAVPGATSATAGSPAAAQDIADRIRAEAAAR